LTLIDFFHEHFLKIDMDPFMLLNYK